MFNWLYEDGGYGVLEKYEIFVHFTLAGCQGEGERGRTRRRETIIIFSINAPACEPRMHMQYFRLFVWMEVKL